MSSQKLKLVVSFDQIDKLTPTLKSIVGLGDNGSKKIGLLKRQAGKLNRELRETKKSLNVGSGNLTALLDKEKSLTNQIEKNNQALSRRNEINKINADRDRVIQKGESYKRSGRDNIVQGASIIAPFVLAGKSALVYDKQLALW